MLLKQTILDAIAGGRVSLVFRRWHRPSVTAGKTMKCAIGVLAIDAVDIVEMDSLTADDALAAGHADLPSLRSSIGPAGPAIYRVALRLAGPDPRTALAAGDEIGAAELHALRRRLDRHDRVAGETPWTRAYLALIGEQPEIPAIRLATGIGADKEDLKRRMRKLKDLGLITALAIGYRLSPRGAAFLAAEAAGTATE